MPTVAFHTLGCKVNQYDTEGLRRQFLDVGYEEVPFDSCLADVYVVNTCSVTQVSDRKSRQMLRRPSRLHPQAVVVAAGCYAQVAAEQVAAIDGVDLVIGNQRHDEVVALVEAARRQKAEGGPALNIVRPQWQAKLHEVFDEWPAGDTSHLRAELKIEEGCDNFCTFCIIPKARGPVRSRPLQAVLQEASRLAALGHREIVLTGILTGAWGREQGEKLETLLAALDNVKGIKRIRLSSVEPTDFTPETIQALAKMRKLCHHLHIPLQSASNHVLTEMRRRYTFQRYQEIVEALRQQIPDVAITTDVMVGFPGESEEDFAQTYERIEQLQLAGLHVFPYSPRPGTAAARRSDQIDPERKHQRTQRLLALGDRLRQQFAHQQVGRLLDVLPEEAVCWGQTRDERGEVLQEPPGLLSGSYLLGHAGNGLMVLLDGDERQIGDVIQVSVRQAVGRLLVAQQVR
ncbi:MAG: tRNA (N(6)-L-threonylcarbamoyladenosine(37)-C(2))-methylthiotransferase MtaB [Firmicutes bacterium]|nr:tRNA (N(6)-L-threonylcarbamoyladenosine(37)-C(2))-methylthiotransferase MtaB [Bacillota bacterium]